MGERNWSLWMKIPPTSPDRPGYSKIAEGMTQEEAERLAETLNFPGRAMPDQGKE